MGRRKGDERIGRRCDYCVQYAYGAVIIARGSSAKRAAGS